MSNSTTSLAKLFRLASEQPCLFLLAGPNGAGKTTLYEAVLKESGLPFVNPDVIAKGLESSIQDPLTRMRASQQVADMTRANLLSDRKSFITETVFSHESKLALIDQARSLGYGVMLFFITVPDVELLKARVKLRVALGGHDVPTDKIASRYERTMNLVSQAIPMCDRAFVFDNSASRQYQRVLAFQHGKARNVVKPLPEWANTILEDVRRTENARQRVRPERDS